MLPPLPGSPLVSIVTPSYNTAAFLDAAIHSVLSQDYPRIEYIVMDAGSGDGTAAILASYAEKIAYHIGPDAGAADAINRGFERATGEILAWISADDLYLPGAVSAAVAALRGQSDAGVVYGEADWIDAEGRSLRRYPTSPNAADKLYSECPICQPAVFFRREVFERAGPLDVNLSSAFDYDLWIRMARITRFTNLDRLLAQSRMHPANKTLGQRGEAFREAMLVQQKHFGYVPFQSVYSYAAHRVDGRDQFESPLKPSLRAYLLSLAAGVSLNRRARLRYLSEWGSAMSWRGLRNVLSE